MNYMKAVICIDTEIALTPEIEGEKSLVIPIPKGTVCRDTGGRMPESDNTPACAEVCVASYRGRKIYTHIPLQHLKPNA